MHWLKDEVPMRLLVIALLWIATPLALAQEWSSGPNKTDVVELFTSEGCSSCPPADRWLSSLKQDPDLFADFIPMAFHVDYWDYIGWKDRFAKPEFSQRQRQYVREGHVSQSYTPGFVINSKEWRDWFRGEQTWDGASTEVGVLKARLSKDNNLKVEFAGQGAKRLHVAFLGMGLTTPVRAGENRGRQLAHDFVVLKMMSVTGEGAWAVSLPEVLDAGQKRTAIAAWVTPSDSLEIIQATGGYLD